MPSKVEFWQVSLWAGERILFKGALIAFLKYRVGLKLSVAFSQDLWLDERNLDGATIAPSF